MKTIQEMASEAGFEDYAYEATNLFEAFAALIRNDERARCISHVYGQAGSNKVAQRTVDAIRSGK